jgi:hypothetical protein
VVERLQSEGAFKRKGMEDRADASKRQCHWLARQEGDTCPLSWRRIPRSWLGSNGRARLSNPILIILYHYLCC